MARFPSQPGGTFPAAPTGVDDGTACADPAVARNAVVAATLTSPAVRLRALSHCGRARIGELCPSLNVFSLQSTDVPPFLGGGILSGLIRMQAHHVAQQCAK